MSFFKKLGRSIGSGFKKLGNETTSIFKKGGHVIARGLGSLAGGSLGSSLGGAAASVFGPEAIPVGAAIGGLIGRTVGGEASGRIEEATRGVASGKRPLFGVRHSGPAPRIALPPVEVPKLPGPRPRLGEGGAGQRRMISDKEKRNELERRRVQRKEDQRFI